MKNLRKLNKSLQNNHFHPLNFFVPWDIRQIKPYEIMLDGTVISMYSFYSEAQENQEFMLKISTSEKRQYNENLIYMIDNRPDWMLEKYNSFSFTERKGRTFYYTVFKIIDCTVDEFIDNRLEFSTLDEIYMHKNSVNPSFVHQPDLGACNVKLCSPEPINFIKEDEYIKESEVLYLWKEIIYALFDLQKARIWHRDIRPDNLVMIPIEDSELLENRKTDYTTQPKDSRNSNNYNKCLRESNINCMMNRITGTDSNGGFSHRNLRTSNTVSSKRMMQNYTEYNQKPSLYDKSYSCEDTASRCMRSSDTCNARSTNCFSSSGSSIINKFKVCLFNFDWSDVIDNSISEKDLEFGIEMKDYPCNNDIYASQHVLDYIDANSNSPEREMQNISLKVKRMMVSGSRKGKRYKKRINPFKEDVFAWGMTLLQIAALHREEEMMGVRDSIVHDQYSEAFADIKHSFMLKLYLRFLLTNDSDERPDFVMAKRVFDQIFLNSKNYYMNLKDDLESQMNIDTWNNDMILEAINMSQPDPEQEFHFEAGNGKIGDYDTPNPTDVLEWDPYSNKFRLANSKSQGNLDEYGEILPLKLDEKFSEVEVTTTRNSKVTEFLKQATESNPRILPMSKINNQRNPFHK